MGLVQGFGQLITLRILLAITQSASVPAIAGIMADSFRARSRSRAVSIYLLSSPISIIAAGWLGGTIADLSGWRMAMFVFSGFGSVVYLMLFLLLREPERTERVAKEGLGDEGGSLAKTLKSVLTVPSYLLLALAFVLACTSYQLILFWLPRHFWELFDVDLAGAGRMSTIWIQTGTVAGLFAGGVWADRWSRRWMSGRFAVQLIGLLICVPSLAVMGAGNAKGVLATAMLAFGFGTWLYLANLWTTTFEVVDPAARSTAIGLLNVSAGVLGAWVSPLVGHLRQSGVIVNLGAVFLGTAVVMLVAAGLLGLIIVFSLPRDYRGPAR
jgi:MFS family permease